MKIFTAVFETEDEVFKVTRMSQSQQAFKNLYGGNGHIIKLTDTTQDWLTESHTFFSENGQNQLYRTLLNAEYGNTEIMFIQDLIQNFIKANTK